MAVAKGNKRLQITLSPVICERLESLVAYDGCTYSNLISQAINSLFEQRKNVLISESKK